MSMLLCAAGGQVQDEDGDWQWLKHGGMPEGAKAFSVTFVLNIFSNNIVKVGR